MNYITDTANFKIEETTAVTLGKFDGLHRGHLKLIRKILKKKTQEMKAVIFTFSLPPADHFRKSSSELLLTNEERRIFVEHLGLDYLVEYPFNKEIASMEPERFVKEILIDKLNAGYIAVGTDFRFGHNRKGDYHLLQELGEKYGFVLEVVEKEMFENQEISSSLVRREVCMGNMEKVNFLLGHPFSIVGEVLHGRKIGRTIGMPTTNLIPPCRKLLPPDGVYASKTIIDGKSHIGVTNIGHKPTVGKEPEKGVETYIFDFEGNLYEKTIEIQLFSFGRPEVKFESLDALKAQLQKDIAFSRSYFEKLG